MNLSKMLKSNRVIALLLAVVMLVSISISGINPTYADDSEVSTWEVAFGSTIFQGTNESGGKIEGAYMYARGYNALIMGNDTAEAYKFGDKFFVYATTAVENVYYDLSGAGGTMGKLVCGGEGLNPSAVSIPVVYNQTERVFLAGPYYTASNQAFYYMDAPDANGDGILQGYESSPVKTDVTVIVTGDPGTGVITQQPTPLVPDVTKPPFVEPGEGGELLGPDGNGDWFKPVGQPGNVYEVVDEHGNSETPKKYVLDEGKDGDPTDGGCIPLVKDGDDFYVEQPDNIFHKVDNNGDYNSNKGIWGGEDGQLGGGDDEDAAKFSGAWYADLGQNIFKSVTGQTSGALVGGGSDKNPVSKPATPVYQNPNNGKYYIGPITDSSDGSSFYYGDAAEDGNGLVDSESDYCQYTDEVWYLDEGNMTTVKPEYLPAGVVIDGEGNFWKLIPGIGDGDNIYGLVTLSADNQTTTPVTDNDGVKVIVDMKSAAPTNKPTWADDRWFAVNDLAANAGTYDSNSDGYLNPAEYVNYHNSLANVGNTTVNDITRSGFQIVAYANSSGEITGWNGAGFTDSRYALIVSSQIVPSTVFGLNQSKIDEWLKTNCPEDIRTAIAGVVFTDDKVINAAASTGISRPGEGGTRMAFALSAAEVTKWSNRASAQTIWTRSLVSPGVAWGVSPDGTILNNISASMYSYGTRPAMWVKLTSDISYKVDELGIDAVDYDTNRDGYLSPSEYVNYQRGVANNGNTNVDEISANGFRIVAYADRAGKVTGWNGDGFAKAQYALIVSKDIEGSTGVFATVQGRLNAWFNNTCPENIRNAAAGVIYSNEKANGNAAQTGVSSVGPGGTITAFPLSAAEAANWTTRRSTQINWTRSLASAGVAWAIQGDGTMVSNVSASMYAHHVLPALWVKVAADYYTVAELAIGAANYDSNGDGYLSAAEYANYQTALKNSADKVNTSEITKAGFQIVAYADATGKINGWSGEGLSNAKYALIVTNEATPGGSVFGSRQDRLNAWFSSDQCPANIKSAAAGVIFSQEAASSNAAATGVSSVGPGGTVMAFSLSAAEATNWSNRLSTQISWTRSTASPGVVWAVNADGSLANNVSASMYSHAIRPALWVQIG